MGKKKKLSLKKEVQKEAVKIEQEISNNSLIKDMEVSNAMEKSLLAKICEYEKGHANSTLNENNHCEISEELTPNFPQRTNEKVVGFLSEEDQAALELGRELMKQTNGGGNLHAVDKEIHKHLNESEGESGKQKRAKLFRMPHNKRLAVAAAAILLLVAGAGATTIGSKSYLKELWEKVVGDGKVSITNVKDMDTQRTEDGEEINIYKEIGEKLGVSSVRLGYRPIDMLFQRATIDEKQKQAQLFYNYKDSIIRYAIYLNKSDSSLGQKVTDEPFESFEVHSDKQVIHVNSYVVKNQNISRYIATFEYEGVAYQLNGAMEKKEFTKILQNLAFFSKNP